MTNEPDDDYPEIAATVEFRRLVLDVGFAVAQFWYEHADVRLPPNIHQALERLDHCAYNPLRPKPPEDMPPEGGV